MVSPCSLRTTVPSQNVIRPSLSCIRVPCCNMSCKDVHVRIPCPVCPQPKHIMGGQALGGCVIVVGGRGGSIGREDEFENWGCV